MTMTSISKAMPAPVAEELVSPEIMRAKGVESATDWFDTDDGVDPASNLEFRVWCHDDLVLFYGGRADFKDLISAWDEGIDSVLMLGPTPSEIGLRRAYLLSDDRGRQSIYNYAVSMAEDWPRETLSEVSQIAEGTE